MGFLRIEALLDEGNPEEISSNFNTLLDTLESEAAGAPTPAQKHALGKAQGAVEKPLICSTTCLTFRAI